MSHEPKRRPRLSELPLEERLKIMGAGIPPTPEELKRREEWSKRVDALREEIGPIDIPINDLLHMTDEELDAKYGREKPKRS